MVNFTSQPRLQDDADPGQSQRVDRNGNALSAGLREDLRAVIARWAPALKELDKH